MIVDNTNAQTASGSEYDNITGTWMGSIIGILPTGQKAVAKVGWRIHHIDLKKGIIDITEISYVGENDSLKLNPTRATYTTYLKDGKLLVVMKNPYLNNFSLKREKQDDVNVLKAEFRLDKFDKGVYFLVKVNDDTSTYKVSNMTPPKVDVVKFPPNFNN